MNIEILRIHEDKVYLNDTQWLASPGSTKLSKPREEISKD